MMENNDYVSFEQANALKKLGYDIPCEHYYTKENASDDEVWLTTAPFSPEDWNNGRNKEPDFLKPLCSAPHVHDVLRWLREKFNWHINVNPDYDGTWYYHLFPIGGAAEEGDSDFHTYESALSSGIDAVLEIIENEF